MWKHKHIIEDNFLSKEHFNFLSNIDYSHIPQEQMVIMANSIQDGAICKYSGEIPRDMLLDIHHQYNSKMIEFLKELAPEKVPLVKHADITLVRTPKHILSTRTHLDVSRKVLSAIVYLTPEKNLGTIVFDDIKLVKGKKVGSGKQEIEWKQNRVFAFSRSETSWHYGAADGISPRITLLYNLKQNDAKDGTSDDDTKY
jgi:hypothetical protein